ncbi:MAG: hypothetical protein IPJ85_03490 [Flavobacteriales bacterium]|nr:hypothetical protein [Flavobacteriales bacterium]
MTRRFLALVVTAVLAVGAASAQSQSFGPYPASEVKAFLEKHPQFKNAFVTDGDKQALCTDALAAKAFEGARTTPEVISPAAMVDDQAPKLQTAHSELKAAPAPQTKGTAVDHRAARERMIAIDEELKSNPSNAKALLIERERLLEGLKQRAPATR